ncbi:MAG: tRNA (adenosine(37)-N6)-dimethylallyltransferase MiaA [Anaerolineae bacterium]|nr:tRNA (adenosine(37)-N6)-dimethylallyltransferase MiaA [Anaerolineae bacterium]
MPSSPGGEPDRAPPLVVIAGPTGIGKTALAVGLAGALREVKPVEVVSADSRQIYRRMDIGTAKPTPAERAAVPHHLIDIVDPDDTLTLAGYQRLAYAAIDAIHARGGLPLLVGGAGQYITAVLEGWSAPEVPPDPALRAALEAEARERGLAALVDRLRTLDPVSAERIDPKNTRRVIRALEVCLNTGQPFSAQRRRQPPPYRALEIGLTMDRELLYTRLDARIDRMMEHGLLEEVRALHRRGYGWALPSMSGLGYAQLGAHLRGEATLDEAVQAIKRDTRGFVRRQYTWFRRHGALSWLDVGALGSPDALVSAAASMIRGWLGAA